jgi:hypothetical protein
VERRLDEPGKRRVLKDPLYGPLVSGTDTSASGKGRALPAKESKKAAPSGKAEEEKKKKSLSL